MHTAFRHLAKRVGEAQDSLAAVLREIEKQAERETTLLEDAAYGREFDDEVAPVQEKVVAAVQEAMELLDAANDAMEQAKQALAEIETF